MAFSPQDYFFKKITNVMERKEKTLLSHIYVYFECALFIKQRCEDVVLDNVFSQLMLYKLRHDFSDS